jgi:oxygen-independent coproporphyrinogen-3 oxidase
MALLKEAEMRSSYLTNKKLTSIYFGGGTPSVLSPSVLQEIITGLRQNFHWDSTAEITIEANPDDLNDDFFKALGDTEINRLSIGIQSFKESDLRLVNRAHTAIESRECLERANYYGYTNLSVDLIYGLPNQSLKDWQWQLEQLKKLEVPHFSAYALTVEEKTVLHQMVAKGTVKVEEEMAAQHFEYLQQFCDETEYQQYELSNFCLPQREAQHNSAYWSGDPYLGLGPSAHSYDGQSRHWNISNNGLYLRSLESDKLPITQEVLSESDRYNEWLMTGLRLEKGLLRSDLERFSLPIQAHFKHESEQAKGSGKLVEEKERIRIPQGQRFFSDGIAADLFHIKD